MTIDDLFPAHTLRPESIEELRAAIEEQKGSIIPVGASTQQYFGNPLLSFDCAVDLRRLNRITEYVPGDLTIHVEAGVTLGELTEALAENNQFLPLDPWNGSSATIGGIAAANAQGPYRATGTIRDWIIGMKVIEVGGKVSKTGGRVVKNVTGYDLARLYTGSIGTLAIIAEISMKLRARYGRTATAVARLQNSTETAKLLENLRRSPLQPVACEWVGPDQEVWVRFGEHPRAVEWQLNNLPRADWTTVDGDEETAVWEDLRARHAKLGAVVLKVITLPSQAQDVIEQCLPNAWIAHAMNGIVLLSVSDPAQIGAIRSKYRTVIERAPLEVRRAVSTFGLTRAEYDLMRKVKDAFDPEGRLNPGRHVDGERLATA